MIYYFLYKTGEFLALTLPLKWGYWLAEKVGFLCYYINYKAALKVIENLKVIFARDENADEEKIKQSAKQIFANFAKYLLEFFRLSKLSDDYIENNITFNNFERIEAYKGKGVILLGAHLGNWELAAAVTARKGLKLNGIALKHKYEKIDLFFKKLREINGFFSVPPGGNSARAILRKLQEGEAVALLGDRDFTQQGIKMDFFNKPFLSPKGPAFFSLKTGCPIICLFTVREKDNHFVFFAESPIFPHTQEVNEESIKQINEKVISLFEKYIKKYHTQWLMLRALWEIDKTEREEII